MNPRVGTVFDSLGHWKSLMQGSAVGLVHVFVQDRWPQYSSTLFGLNEQIRVGRIDIGKAGTAISRIGRIRFQIIQVNVKRKDARTDGAVLLGGNVVVVNIVCQGRGKSRGKIPMMLQHECGISVR